MRWQTSWRITGSVSVSFEYFLHVKGQFQKFEAVINEYLESGHAEEVPLLDFEKLPQEVFYLPHTLYPQGVKHNEGSDCVWCICKNFEGVSLNDTLFLGSTIYLSLVIIKNFICTELFWLPMSTECTESVFSDSIITIKIHRQLPWLQEGIVMHDPVHFCFHTHVGNEWQGGHFKRHPGCTKNLSADHEVKSSTQSDAGLCQNQPMQWHCRRNWTSSATASSLLSSRVFVTKKGTPVSRIWSWSRVHKDTGYYVECLTRLFLSHSSRPSVLSQKWVRNATGLAGSLIHWPWLITWTNVSTPSNLSILPGVPKSGSWSSFKLESAIALSHSLCRIDGDVLDANIKSTGVVRKILSISFFLSVLFLRDNEQV